MPSAERTRRSASASTSASSDTLAPFGKLISIAPRRAVRCASRAGFVLTSAGGGAVAAPNSSSFTGTKAGPITSGAATAPGFSFSRPAPPIAPALARATYPFEDQIGVQPVPTRDRCNRCARSKSLLDDPLALIEASRSPPRPSSVLRRHPVSTSDSGGHLIQSKCSAKGGRQITLTLVSRFDPQRHCESRPVRCDVPAVRIVA